MTDYNSQPPPSTGTTEPASVFPAMHPVTGSDVAPVALIGTAALVLGVVVVAMTRWARR